MYRTTFLLLAMTGLLLFAEGQNSVRITISKLPDYHAEGSEVFIAGNFNGWNPHNHSYQFRKNAEGNLFIDLKLNAGSYEYKITRGSWEAVETKKGGAATTNRILKVDGDGMHQTIEVEEWADRFPSQPKKSTASSQVKIIDTAFLIPQLNRTRRVWIYLPADYSSSGKKYPVLYMHDGQNVFDDATSFAGEWGVDETLDNLGANKENCIVVAIDNGGIKRMNEYNSLDDQRFGKGEGNEYIDFIAKTLKPHIDKNYRTKKKKDDTFIAGSSMGGLISMYAVLRYPKVFGAAGVFSPSFQISPEIYTQIAEKGKKVKSRIYLFGGKLEGEAMVADILKVFEAMRKVSKSEIEVVIRAEGRHDEPTWRKEFPLFYTWLMKEN